MIGWFDANSGFVVSMAAIVAMIVATGIMHRYVIPMATLIKAQLKANDGGSLVDRVNRIEPNHKEARREWAALHIQVGKLRVEMTDKQHSVTDAVATMATDLVEIRAQTKAAAKAAEDRGREQNERHSANLRHFDAIYGRLGGIEAEQEFAAALSEEALKHGPAAQQEAVKTFLETHPAPARRGDR